MQRSLHQVRTPGNLCSALFPSLGGEVRDTQSLHPARLSQFRNSMSLLLPSTSLEPNHPLPFFSLPELQTDVRHLRVTLHVFTEGPLCVRHSSRHIGSK